MSVTSRDAEASAAIAAIAGARPAADPLAGPAAGLPAHAAVETGEPPPDYLAGIARVRAALERHAGLDPEAPPLPEPQPLPSLLAGDAASTLGALCRLFRLSAFERDVLLLAAGMELDATFAPLCARAQVDPRREYPTFGLALAALPGSSWQALLPDAPLRYWQLVRLAPGGGLTTSELAIDERILHYLLGLDSRDDRLAGLLEPVREAGALLPSQERLAAQLARTWERTRGGADFPVVELCGEDLRSKWALAASACQRLGWRLYAMAAEALPTGAAELDNLLRLWHREAILAPAALLLAGDDLRPDEPHEAALRRFVDLAHGALLVTRRRRLPPRHRPVLSLDLGKPAFEEQRDEWRRLLESIADGPAAAALDEPIETLADHFNLHAAEIRSAAVEAIGRWSGAGGNGSAAAALGAALWETCRARARPALVDLAEPLEPRAGWEDLVLPEGQRQILREIVSHVRRRGLVYRGWGFDRKTARGQGVSVLFGGPSGTGKTLAAEVMAAELALDLYRIDLSSVVSKYIGETEKNLQRIFDAAEAGGTILLFDEADALFGKRSEVKDSHDRYANLEVSYLLQRMESYRGLAILTTNMPDSLDSAFKRRLRFIVDFPFPDLAQRRELWRRVFPASTPTEGLDFDRLARLNVAGGHVRNIALHAAFLAAEGGRAVTMRDLLAATRRELAKAGRALSDAEVRDWVG
jgi:hypothetical protein